MNFDVIVLLAIKRESSSTYTSSILLNVCNAMQTPIVFLTNTHDKLYYFLYKDQQKCYCAEKRGKGGRGVVETLPELTKVSALSITLYFTPLVLKLFVERDRFH